MAILKTPDDAQIQIGRHNGTLCIWPIWQAQKHRLGYTREIRYIFFDSGGHVAMAKRYRQHAKEVGLFKTLAEKKKDVPAIDKLVGAANVWCWDKDAVGMAKELQAAGIERILWSAAAKPETLKGLNALPNVLTSRYDIYQDAMNPENFPKIRWKHGDWTSEGWPHHMMKDAQNNFIKGWGVEAKDGTMIPCGVLCDKVAIPYAQSASAKNSRPTRTSAASSTPPPPRGGGNAIRPTIRSRARRAASGR
ncbi:MAG: hypothetical protein QM813_06025 [Verrucomicrobiota bacterium]